MAYKAQLVVRARNKKGAMIIERVKEMASDEGKTFSDMAVDLLARGLDSEEGVSASDEAEEEEDDDSESAPAKAPAPVKEKPAPAPRVAKKKKPKSPRAPLPPEEAGPAVDPELPPKEILAHYLKRREEKGERAAARILVDFFAAAGPAAGGKIKKLLQQNFSAQEFAELMEPIKETEEYAAYTQRAIFGAPSPYSQVN